LIARIDRSNSGFGNFVNPLQYPFSRQLLPADRWLLLAIGIALAACSADDSAGSGRPDAGGVVEASTWRPQDDAANEAPAADTGNPGADTSDGGGQGDARPDGRDAGKDAPGPTDVNTETNTGKLLLCLRLNDPQHPEVVSNLSRKVVDGYLSALFVDCRITKIVDAIPGGLNAFANDLLSWNVSFWGCRDTATNEFGLIHDGVSGLTSADVATLIDHYMKAAIVELSLSAGEQLQMRQALTALGQTVVTRQSDEYTLSNCADGGGDAADEAAPNDAQGADGN